MTQYPELTVTVNHRPVRWEEIKHWKARRAATVLQLLKDHDQTLRLNNQPLPQQTFYQLSDDDLIAAAKDTKLALTPNQIEDLLQNDLQQSDAMWHRFMEQTPANAPLKAIHVQFDLAGITPEILTQVNLDQLQGTGFREHAFDLHPEHYLFSQEGNVQDVIETFGEYGLPTHFHLVMLDPHTHKLPEAINPNTKKVIFGKGLLASDGFDTHQYALHQFMPNATGDGLHIDLGIFTPAGMDDAALIGHQQHFAIEFASMFTKILDQLHASVS
ncbi:hypothetical protein [Levilactobacillus namurensis]|uniref:hypothetical protein n=1 Tax=Levilactobacillus namurensis TaxID=380393 RepID=UPI001DA40662|nr:hypothetical protein [Levilactobacillus namurensis]HJE45847.1 hypothetical protein [Levilactobacillus namurensis]